jgi:hypothetical protein
MRRMCDAGAMEQIVCPVVSAEDRARLEATIADCYRVQKHVAQGRIIMGSADQLSFAEITKRAARPPGGQGLAAAGHRSIAEHDAS